MPGRPASVRQASQAKASASISSPLIPASSVVETSVPGSSAGSGVNQTAAIPDTDNGAAAENEAGDPSTRSSYVINTNTGKFHRPDCASATQMKPENRKDVTASRDELVQEGYEPWKQCKP